MACNIYRWKTASGQKLRATSCRCSCLHGQEGLCWLVPGPGLWTRPGPHPCCKADQGEWLLVMHCRIGSIEQIQCCLTVQHCVFRKVFSTRNIIQICVSRFGLVVNRWWTEGPQFESASALFSFQKLWSVDAFLWLCPAQLRNIKMALIAAHLNAEVILVVTV